MEFPIFKTKVPNVTKKYNINDPVERREYFHAKAGDKINDIKEYLDKRSFLGFLLAKKQAGKGTYSKLFEEIVGADRFFHLSVGDIVRDAHKLIGDKSGREDLVRYLNKHYRGFISVDGALDALLGRSTETLVPTEFVLTLVRRGIEGAGERGIFIDGFPRSMDQVSYSLYFREIINLRAGDPDFFVLFDVPEKVLDARMRGRIICPICKTSRHLSLMPTKFVEFDKESGEFYLLCDNKECKGFKKQKLEAKEGDHLGIEAIRERLEMDEKLIKMAGNLSGIPKLYIRNSIPVKEAGKYVDDYEITPFYNYEWDGKAKKVKVKEKPWVFKDDKGVDSFSLLAPAVVLSLISQLYELLIRPE